MTPTRRSFLATLGTAAIGALIRPGCAPAATRARIERVGLQLYTVRTEMRRDLEGTLARVAEIGYREVEFAGYFDRTPAQIAALLERHSLAAPSTHIGLDQMQSDWERVAQDAAAIGHTYVTVPWLAAQERRTVDDWKRTAADFNEQARRARSAGLRFAYHNHDFEFTRIADVVPFDVLLAGTDPDLVDFELDIYWITRAGFDAVDYLVRFPGRFTMTHLKDSGGAPDHEMVDVGSGSIDFAHVIAAANASGVRHHFVEHDRPADALSSIRSSYAYLSDINNN
ncbi:MAG TPA: sugar phosphate isomerase/epimerase [Longimicrobiales bacterium]|nr:sugar phosphate isomerase/epimerase [Longimicrobiales bacterium]